MLPVDYCHLVMAMAVAGKVVSKRSGRPFAEEDMVTEKTEYLVKKDSKHDDSESEYSDPRASVSISSSHSSRSEMSSGTWNEPQNNGMNMEDVKCKGMGVYCHAIHDQPANLE
jgi:hypothetical protein